MEGKTAGGDQDRAQVFESSAVASGTDPSRGCPAGNPESDGVGVAPLSNSMDGPDGNHKVRRGAAAHGDRGAESDPTSQPDTSAGNTN